MDDLKMQKQTLKKAYKKTKRKHITPWKILAIICAVVMIVSIPLSILLQKFDNTMAARFGGSFWKLQNEDANAQYYTSDFNSAEEMVNYGLALTQQVEAEGAALLMNNNNALPLAADAKVSTFSSSSVNLVYGGTGSGNIDASTADTLRTALEKVGVTVNPTLWDFYTVGAGKDYARSKSGTVAKSSEVTAEVPWDVYTDEVKDSVAQYGDAAIVTLSRVGGEGADLSYGEVNYLALDDNEKEMLQNVAEMKKNGTVKIYAGQRGNHPYYRVEDNGIGIPKEEQKRIFERFYRVDKSHSRETGGTGLGLSIVKHGALMHNADIILDSAPGQGTKMELVF